MYFKQTFPTAALAQAALTTALATLNAKLVADSVAAGSKQNDARATSTLTATESESLIATTGYATGALPENADAMARVTARVATSFSPLGEKVRVTSLATQAIAPTPSTATVRVTFASGNQYKARFKATVAAKVRAYFTTVVNVPINTRLIDPATGKV